MSATSARIINASQSEGGKGTDRGWEAGAGGREAGAGGWEAGVGGRQAAAMLSKSSWLGFDISIDVHLWFKQSILVQFISSLGFI